MGLFYFHVDPRLVGGRLEVRNKDTEAAYDISVTSGTMCVFKNSDNVTHRIGRLALSPNDRVEANVTCKSSTGIKGVRLHEGKRGEGADEGADEEPAERYVLALFLCDPNRRHRNYPTSGPDQCVLARSFLQDCLADAALPSNVEHLIFEYYSLGSSFGNVDADVPMTPADVRDKLRAIRKRARMYRPRIRACD